MFGRDSVIHTYVMILCSFCFQRYHPMRILINDFDALMPEHVAVSCFRECTGDRCRTNGAKSEEAIRILIY